MLQPKRTKFRKAHKGRIKGAAKGGTTLNFGGYGLKAQEPARITARQIEAARRAIQCPGEAATGVPRGSDHLDMEELAHPQHVATRASTRVNASGSEGQSKKCRI